LKKIIGGDTGNSEWRLQSNIKVDHKGIEQWTGCISFRIALSAEL
jgi:hypothetical protein